MKTSPRQTTPRPTAPAAKRRTLNGQPAMGALHRRAQAELRRLKKVTRFQAGNPRSDANTQRLLHELQVHKIELEMQNGELAQTRDKLEMLLADYTDLYDFAPVGYMSLDENGKILRVNLTGAALLGVGRSRLINRPLLTHVLPASRPIVLNFLKEVFAGSDKRVCEANLLREGSVPFWANIHGAAASSAAGPQKWCRVVVSDLTALKLSEQAQRRVEELANANRELKLEVARRQAVEKSLKQSEQHQARLLTESHAMQDQLRHLSRQILRAQEEERRRISRELHDVIAQTLTGINVQLAALAKQTRLEPDAFDHSIIRTQRMVEKSVEIVHRFARELRPAVLDDLGLIPALHAYIKNFTTQTGIRGYLTAFAGVERLEIARRTVLFRVAQEALTNVARHAHASRVHVNIDKLRDGICMKIKDDGRSFYVERVLHANGGKRLGLLGMRERLEMVGGRFAVDSAAGKGTTVVAKLPFDWGRGGRKKSPPAVAAALSPEIL